MTLHAAWISPAMVISVGDRLLTTQANGTLEDWDPYANKAVVVEAINGLVTINFAGLAFIDSTPTDTWLADMVLAPPRHLTLGQVLHRIEEGIFRDLLRQPEPYRANGIEVMVAGWTWKRKQRFGSGRPRTFLRIYAHSGRWDARTMAFQAPDMVYSDECAIEQSEIFTIGNKAVVPFLSHLYAELIDQLQDSDRLTERGIEGVLGQLIRSAAARPEGVGIGTDCVSVYMSPKADIGVRHLRDIAKQSRSAYQPWLITPTIVGPPTEWTGTIEAAIPYRCVRGDRTVVTEAVPPLPANPFGSRWEVQARKEFPSGETHRLLPPFPQP